MWDAPRRIGVLILLCVIATACFCLDTSRSTLQLILGTFQGDLSSFAWDLRALQSHILLVSAHHKNSPKNSLRYINGNMITSIRALVYPGDAAKTLAMPLKILLRATFLLWKNSREIPSFVGITSIPHQGFEHNTVCSCSRSKTSLPWSYNISSGSAQ